VFAFDQFSRLGRQRWLAIALVAVVALLFLPMVVWKTVWLGQGDVNVFFRAGWAVWTGYPLYQVTDQHGWTYHYPPTFALLMGLFANPLPDYLKPSWALPFPAAVVVWYLLNIVFLILAVHFWAVALERYRPFKSAAKFLSGEFWLRFGPVLAVIPFIGDGLARGQPTPLLLLLIVVFLILYAANHLRSAALVLGLAVAIKEFPLVLAILPLLRRDWKFIAWLGGWCIVLLVVLPAMCIGPSATLDLYRSMWTDHLAGILSGLISGKLIREVAPGGYDAVGIGAALARVAAGGPFETEALPAWASIVQYLFDVGVIAATAMLGLGGFWNWRGAQPAKGYPLLVAGAVLAAAIPLMVSVAKPNYISFVVPLLGVLLIERWRRDGDVGITAPMIGWASFAWLSMISLELRWNWLFVAAPMTWALLFLGRKSLSLVGDVSADFDAAAGRGPGRHQGPEQIGNAASRECECKFPAHANGRGAAVGGRSLPLFSKDNAS
jgi:hypothetical protein